MSNKYIVTASTKNDWSIVVEADNEQEAQNIAMATPLNTWNNLGYEFLINFVERQ